MEVCVSGRTEFGTDNGSHRVISPVDSGPAIAQATRGRRKIWSIVGITGQSNRGLAMDCEAVRMTGNKKKVKKKIKKNIIK